MPVNRHFFKFPMRFEEFLSTCVSKQQCDAAYSKYYTQGMRRITTSLSTTDHIYHCGPIRL